LPNKKLLAHKEIADQFHQQIKLKIKLKLAHFLQNLFNDRQMSFAKKKLFILFAQLFGTWNYNEKLMSGNNCGLHKEVEQKCW